MKLRQAVPTNLMLHIEHDFDGVEREVGSENGPATSSSSEVAGQLANPNTLLATLTMKYQ